MKLVILDRDDTLILVPPDRRYLYGDDEIVLADGAVTFLRQLSAAGVAAAIATNQQGVAQPEYPDMTIESVDRFHRRLLEELRRRQAPVDRIYVCPHGAEAQCVCRKPRPGLYLQAMRDFGVDPQAAAAVGDRPRDVQAAVAAGIRAVFLIRHAGIEHASGATSADVKVISSFDDCLHALGI
jgi:D-glycero-D-manno-heptose 1,7-bisphosphate phosphatase